MADKGFDGVGKVEALALAEGMGRMFCELANSVRLAGIDKREAAAAMLANYRLGVDIAFGLLENLPGVGQVTDAVNTATSYIPNTGVQGFQDSVKDGVASALSGIDMGSLTAETKAQAESARQTLDQMTKENVMSSMARDPALLSKMGVVFPKEMLVNPHGPIPSLVPDPARPPDGVRIPDGYC